MLFVHGWPASGATSRGGPVDLHVIEQGTLLAHEEFAAETAAALLPVLTGRAGTGAPPRGTAR